MTNNPMTPAEQAREALEKAVFRAIDSATDESFGCSRVIDPKAFIEAIDEDGYQIVSKTALAPAADEVRLKVRWNEQGNLWVGNFCPGFVWRPHAATWVADFIQETGTHLRLGQYPTRDAARAALLEKVTG